jgi:hypothetical protein
MREMLAMVILTVAAAGFLLLSDLYQMERCLEFGGIWNAFDMECGPDPGFVFRHNGRV